VKTKMLFRIAILTILTTINNPSFSFSKSSGKDWDLAFVLGTCESGVDSVYVIEMDQAILKLDKNFWGDYLLRARTLKEFRSLVEEYRQKFLAEKLGLEDSAAAWNELRSRLEWGRSNARTAIDDTARDVFWDLVLGKGIPESIWSMPGEYYLPGSSRTTPCDLYVAIWSNGEQVVCHSESPSGIPRRIISKKDMRPHGKPIYPEGIVGVFLDPCSTYSLWMGLMVTAEQITAETFGLGQLQLVMSIKSGLGELIAVDSVEINLDPLRGFSSATEGKGTLASNGYLGVSGLSPGKYRITLIVLGGRNNSGQFSREIDIPSKNTGFGASDIFLLIPPKAMAWGGDLDSGVVRGDRNLYISPIAAANTKSEVWNVIYPYWEFSSPTSSEEGLITASLIPIGKNPRKKHPVIIYGEMDVSEVEGEEYPYGGWLHPHSIPSWIDEKERSAESDGVVLLKEEHRRIGGQVEIFNTPIPIGVDGGIKPGRYWLKLQATNIEGNQYFGVAYTPIEIR